MRKSGLTEEQIIGFETLHQARMAVAVWRTDYNEVRPHGSLGRLPPARFAEPHRPQNPSSNLEPGLPLLIGTSTGGRSISAK